MEIESAIALFLLADYYTMARKVSTLPSASNYPSKQIEGKLASHRLRFTCKERLFFYLPMSCPSNVWSDEAVS